MSATLPTAQFDFSDLSWGESVTLERMQMQAKTAIAANDGDAIMSVMDAMYAFLARVTVSVPNSYIRRSCQDMEHDWTDPATFRDHIRMDKVASLLGDMAQAQTPDNATKN